MQRDDAIGMFIGLFVGDALGAPLEFTDPNTGDALTEMTGGGVHNTSPGEWTDDGAMAVCIVDAYIAYKRFAPAAIAQNFRQWRNSGAFGTRTYCFDIGNTTSDALAASSNKRPYGGSAHFATSGNGGIMRLAPHVLANHNNKTMAIADSVAGSVLTHGSADCVAYAAQLASELFDGATAFDQRLSEKGFTKDNGSVMGCYAQAWDSIVSTTSFEDAIVHAVNKGGDADTVGAVTGMIAGRLYGYSNIPKRWLEKLHKHDELLTMADKLYQLGERA